MTATASARRTARRTYRTSPVVYSVIRWIISLLMRIAYRYEVEGRENIPLKGRLIIAVNHLHVFDPGAVAPAVPRKIVTLVAGKWQSHLLFNWILRLAGVIFIRRGEVDRTALRACLDVLQNDGVLALAPEGTRSRTGGLQIAKSGISYLARHTNAPILPISIAGTERFRTAWRHLRRPVCRVTIGRPFRLPVRQGKVSAEQLQEDADLIMLRIGQMLPESYRGAYTERIDRLESGDPEELSKIATLIEVK